jgi:hypothetical protein
MAYQKYDESFIFGIAISGAVVLSFVYMVAFIVKVIIPSIMG